MRVGHLLAVQLLQLGLGIEEIHLADAAFHVEEDASFGLGCEVRWLDGKGLRRSSRSFGSEQAIPLEQGSESEASESTGGGGQEIPPGDLNDVS